MSITAALKEIKRLIQLKSTYDAFELLRKEIQNPKSFLEYRRELLLLLGEVSSKRWNKTWGKRILIALDNPLPDTVFQLAKSFTERNCPDIAEALLIQALKQTPEEGPLLWELVAALELQGKNREAVTVLDQAHVSLKNNFLFYYLTAFNCAVTGDYSRTRKLFPLLQNYNEKQYLVMTERIGALLKRESFFCNLTSIPEKVRNVFILSGALLLDEVEHITDIYFQILKEAERVVSLCLFLNQTPSMIVALPDEMSSCLGQLLGQLFNIPVIPWSACITEGMLVAWDMGSIDSAYLLSLSVRNPDQLFYVHSAEKGVEYSVSPDFLGCIYTFMQCPWDGDPDDPFAEVEDIPEPEDFICQVLQSRDNLSNTDEYTETVKSLLAVGGAENIQLSRRESLWAGVLP